MLPLKRIILYKHGVGYFERQGEVEDDAQVELQFRASEMNDVLKSLTVLDLTSGLISSISYDSTKPVAQQLEDIAIRVADGTALTSLLSQIKGARVRLQVGSLAIEGVVSGIQTSAKEVEGGVTQSHRVVLLVGGTTLETFELNDVKSIALLEESLQKDLQHLLDILFSANKKDLKRLTVFAHGQGKRDILVGYTVEAPVWKTSYRILMTDDQSPLLQGWALVDNTQEEDWTEVGLSLVAGLPVSFVHDLYSPRYKKRPTVLVEEEEAYAPPQLEAGYGGAPMAAMAPAPSKSMRMMAPQAMMEARQRSVDVQTRSVEVGDQFHYDIKNPVTVKRSQSALVPILQENFEGQRVAIYNESVRAKNPMSAILFKNTTGLMLEGGPLTVFENEIYVGESMLDTMKPDEQRIVPYSVELGCSVSFKNEYRTDNVTTVTINHGAVNTVSYRITVRTYVIYNKTTKPIDLFIDHPITVGSELVETPVPFETTPTQYRFRLPLPPKMTLEFGVHERGATQERVELRAVDTRVLKVWISARRLPAAALAAIEEIVRLNEDITRLQALIERREADIAAIEQNQARLRQNLQALGASQDERSLRERYVRDMTTDEDTLRAHREEIARTKDEREKQEELLSTKVAQLKV